jgi:DnaJ-class molecular chaperone
MANIRTHYDNLRVARNAPDSVIKAAYKALCQTYHPDKFQGSNAEAERIMKLINASYAVLIDPVKRAEHDAWIREKEAAANQQSEKAQFSETGNATEQKDYQK